MIFVIFVVLKEGIMSGTKQIKRDQLDQLIADEFGVNATYVIDLLQQFERDPLSLDLEWRIYFTELLGERRERREFKN